MIFLLICIEEDKFIPDFNPPGIKIEDVYFKMKRHIEFEVGLGNNLDFVNFLRFDNNQIYGFYIRKKFLFEILKYDYHRFFGCLKIIGKTMNPFIYTENRIIVSEMIPLILNFDFSGFKDTFLITSSIDLIVPYDHLLIGFTGGKKKTIFTGMFLQYRNKRLTLGKDILEMLLFSDIFFVSLKYSYDFLPFYDFWSKTDYNLLPVSSLEFLYGPSFLKVGFVKYKPFIYFSFENSEFFFYNKNISSSILCTIKNRFSKTRFIFICSSDYSNIKGLMGIFIIPERRSYPFFGGIYSSDKFWRVFAGFKFK